MQAFYYFLVVYSLNYRNEMELNDLLLTSF